MTARLCAFAISTAVIGLYFLWRAIQLPGGAEVTTLIGPRTWPLAILILMLGLVAVMFLLLALKGSSFFGTEDASVDEVQAVHPWRHIGVLGLTIGYIAAMEFTGYLAATAVFAAAINILLGERRPLRVFLTTAAAVVLVALVFDRLLSIPLP